MNDATVTVTFNLPYAWDEQDTVETGMQPDAGVNEYLVGLGLSSKLIDLAAHFGMELRRWGVSVHERTK